MMTPTPFESTILATVQRIEQKLDALSRGSRQSVDLSTIDLEDPRNDVEIRYDPKYWEGQSYVGLRFSQTEPAYLEAQAKYYQWRADNPKEGKEKYAGLDLKRSHAALAWAKRLEGQGVRTKPPTPAQLVGEEDINF